MSELLDRAKASLEGVTPGPWQVVGYGNIQTEAVGEYPPLGKIYSKGNQQFVAAARQLVPELVAEAERRQDLITEFRKRDDVATGVIKNLCDERDHWKSLWQRTVKDSTKVIQERDEALREVEQLKARIAMEWSEDA